MSKEEEEKKEENDVDDEELIKAAELEIDQERLLVAAKLLRKVRDQELLQASHKTVLRKAQITQDVIDLHLQPPEQGWNKQSESHGKHDTIIYYKVEDSSKLTCRIETPIESSLLVPLLAVFNESELYEKWMPRWKIPFQLGLRESKKIKDQPGRGAQVVQVIVDMPFPLSDREIVYDNWGVDAIHELGLLSLKGMSLEVGDEDGLVQPPEPGVKRIDFDAGFVIRKCPEDHPCWNKSKHQYPEGEHVFLLSLTQYVNAHVSYVPQSLINFGTRTALSGQWGALLQVAEDVRDGKRPDHEKAIKANQELYGWIEQRKEAMFAKLDKDD